MWDVTGPMSASVPTREIVPSHCAQGSEHEAVLWCGSSMQISLGAIPWAGWLWIRWGAMTSDGGKGDSEILRILWDKLSHRTDLQQNSALCPYFQLVSLCWTRHKPWPWLPVQPLVVSLLSGSTSLLVLCLLSPAFSLFFVPCGFSAH